MADLVLVQWMDELITKLLGGNRDRVTVVMTIRQVRRSCPP